MDKLLPVFANTGELPPTEGHDEYWPTRSDPSLYLPAVKEICRLHHLPADDLHKYPVGAMVVFAMP